MKKLLAMALALVMALGVTTMAWAEETGYNNEALPTGPDMSGTVITVTPENAQYTLDGAYGSIDGKTINFTESISSVLLLGRPTKYAGSNTEYYVGGFDETAENYQKFDTAEALAAHKSSSEWTAKCYYYRTISGVKFTADAGVTLAGFSTDGATGHVYGSEAKPIYDYVRDSGTWCTDTNSSYNAALTMTNVTFEGLTIKNNVYIHDGGEHTASEINGIRFVNCTFQGDTTQMESNKYQAIKMQNDGGNGLKNVSVVGCTFENYFQAVYIQDVTNVEVKNNSISNTKHNAIALQSNEATVAGDIVIKENYIDGAGDKAIRLGNIGAESTITVNNNIMVNSGDNSGQLFKAGTIAEGASTNLENNYWGGKDAATAVSTNGGVTVPSKTGITGGTFKGEVTADMLAEGMEAVKNADGSYTVAEKTPPRYYYNSTTTTDTKKDETKGSPKTFDAGVGIYAVSAVLSVTGMAYVGKKKF